jgi:hypothetical protein
MTFVFCLYILIIDMAFVFRAKAFVLFTMDDLAINNITMILGADLDAHIFICQLR